MATSMVKAKNPFTTTMCCLSGPMCLWKVEVTSSSVKMIRLDLVLDDALYRLLPRLVLVEK